MDQYTLLFSSGFASSNFFQNAYSKSGRFPNGSSEYNVREFIGGQILVNAVFASRSKFFQRFSQNRGHGHDQELSTSCSQSLNCIPPSQNPQNSEFQVFVQEGNIFLRQEFLLAMRNLKLELGVAKKDVLDFGLKLSGFRFSKNSESSDPGEDVMVLMDNFEIKGYKTKDKNSGKRKFDKMAY